MAADKAAENRPRDLADEIRRGRIAEHAADDGVGHAVANDAGDAGHQAAERKPHEEAQDDELPARGDEGLRDQEQPSDQGRDDDDLPMPDAIGEPAEP